LYVLEEHEHLTMATQYSIFVRFVRAHIGLLLFE